MQYYLYVYNRYIHIKQKIYNKQILRCYIRMTLFFVKQNPE
jgi:hypothetical protein